MYCRFFYLSFTLLFIISFNAYGDILRLKNFDEKIDAKIIEVNDEFVKVKIPQEEIGSISVESEKDSKYTDTVFVSVNGRECKVVCKIVQIAKEPASITLKIPRKKISGIQIAFPGSGDDVGSGGKGQSPLDTERLKEQIMEELRREFEKKQGLEDATLEEKIKEELSAELEKKRKIREEIYEEKNFGGIKGRMLYKDKPLPGCRVKVTVLDTWGFFGNAKEGLKFETITDENGRYHFKKVPPAGYKLYWKPPTESSWIRKIKMEPDIYVEAGEVSYMSDRETNVRTAN